MKYIVKVKEVHEVEVEVEAESRVEARIKVAERLHDEDYMQNELVYSHTLGPEEWEVI